MLGGGAPGTPGQLETQVPTNAEEAKKLLLESATKYAEAVRNIKPEDVGKPVQLHFGKMPLGFIASMGATDLLHHHGQIAYIQTILGDTESHFDMSLLPKS